MKLVIIAVLAMFAFAQGPAFACDEMCKDGEYYSDNDEMCMPLSVDS